MEARGRESGREDLVQLRDDTYLDDAYTLEFGRRENANCGQVESGQSRGSGSGRPVLVHEDAGSVVDLTGAEDAVVLRQGVDGRVREGGVRLQARVREVLPPNYFSR